MEDAEVFEAVHALVFRWISEGMVSGLRIDHPDGLFDPTAYFLNLQERYCIERAKKEYEKRQQPPERWPPRSDDIVRPEIRAQQGRLSKIA